MIGASILAACLFVALGRPQVSALICAAMFFYLS